jgi:hypothetical protein
MGMWQMPTIALIVALALLAGACAPASQAEPESSEGESSRPIDKPTAPSGRTANPPAPEGTAAVPATTVDLGQLTPAATAQATEEVEMPAPGVPNLGDKMASAAAQDLAAYLNIDVGDITVVEVAPMEWRDSSLGCPAPGEGYLTVITPGFLVLLEAAGGRYEYHTDQAGRFVLCQDGQPVRRGPQ